MKIHSRRGQWYYYQPLRIKHPRLTKVRLWFSWKNDLLDVLWPPRLRRWERQHGITR